MDFQTAPTSLAPTPSGNRSLILIALIVVFAIGSLGFGILSVVAFAQANTAKTTLNKAKTDAANTAREEQKRADLAAAQAASESPYRSYIAPGEYGSFEIKFPKTWSAQVTEIRNSGIQVNLLLHPDIVRSSNGTDDLRAAKVMLQQKSFEDFVKQYTTQKTITRADVTISGIKGAQFTGKFADKRTVRLVAIPVRDKTLAFITEDANYAGQFDQILAQAKIIP